MRNSGNMVATSIEKNESRRLGDISAGQLLLLCLRPIINKNINMGASAEAGRVDRRPSSNMIASSQMRLFNSALNHTTLSQRMESPRFRGDVGLIC